AGDGDGAGVGEVPDGGVGDTEELGCSGPVGVDGRAVGAVSVVDGDDAVRVDGHEPVVGGVHRGDAVDTGADRCGSAAGVVVGGSPHPQVPVVVDDPDPAGAGGDGDGRCVERDRVGVGV